MYAQARGWVEFWFAWLAVDLVGVPLNFHSGLPFSGLVYIIYFVLVIAGMYAWWQQTRRPDDPSDRKPAAQRRHRRGRSDGMTTVTAPQDRDRTTSGTTTPISSSTPSSGRSPTSPPDGPSWSSTTRTGRTRAT